jgi:hypothetical protein
VAYTPCQQRFRYVKKGFDVVGVVRVVEFPERVLFHELVVLVFLET